MEWEPTHAVTIRRGNVDGHARGPGLPDDGQLRGKRAKWATDEEVQRRRAAGACFRCGRLGCSIGLCPLAAARRPGGRQPPHAVRARPAYVPPPVAAMVEEEEEGSGVAEPQE